jgi:general secretion pathway protein G
MLSTYKRLREARNDASGFTLIELLIVIVILGVLAGIVVFAVSAFNNDGKTAACKADNKNIEIAQEARLAKKGGYAPNIATLVSEGYLKEPPATAEGFTTNSSGVISHTCSIT